MSETIEVVCCSNCRKPLVEFLVSDGLDLVWKFKVLCPHCGDASFIKEYKGIVSFRDTPETGLSSFSEEDGVTIVSTVKR